MSSILERNGTTNTYIECECGRPSHIVRFSTDDEQEGNYEPTLSIDVQLNTGGFWTRLRNAIYYVLFGEEASWSGSVLNIDAVEKIEHVFLDFKRSHRAWRLRKENLCITCEGKGEDSSCGECGLCSCCKGVNEHKPECYLGRSIP